MNAITDAVRSSLPARHKSSGMGWESFNCVMCQAMGEPRADTRNRGGIVFNSDGGFAYHCFNCKAKVAWRPGMNFGKKTELLLKNLGLSWGEIRTLRFKAWQIRGQIEANVEVDYKPKKVKMTFNEVPLPEKSKSFKEWASESNPPKGFLNALNYIKSRGNCFLNAYTYYWTPNLRHSLNRRVIVPFYWEDKIVGYASRLVTAQTSTELRYFSESPHNYLFNNKVLYIKERQYLILVEGVFDAIAIDGIGLLGSSLTNDQINWINSSKKEIIFLPDRNKASDAIIDVAINEKWNVSFPEWESDVDDVAKAAGRYGKIYTLKSILDSRQESKSAINVRRRRWCKLR